MAGKREEGEGKRDPHDAAFNVLCGRVKRSEFHGHQRTVESDSWFSFLLFRLQLHHPSLASILHDQSLFLGVNLLSREGYSQAGDRMIAGKVRDEGRREERMSGVTND